ncbi:MAG: GGDEF domain-containing protein [Alphaproteobacteria bacterium]|nr:MAG: GGDEF domain-containing protein [Alphaproteobacteria bacterium]
MQDEYNQSAVKAKQFAAEAFARIDQEGLPAVPDVFELWFSYFSGNNAEVVRSIEIMTSQNFELTLERCQELHRRLLNSDKSKETLEKAEKIVGNTLTDVDEMFTSIQSSNDHFGGSLESVGAKIANTKDPEELKKLVDNMMSDTQKMMSENQSLEQKLKKSSTTMQALKTEMESVRKEAFTDGLTGIANRKKFDMEIELMMAEAREEKQPITLIIGDIDHFKSFNDTYGHQIGDQVLRLVARTFHDGVKGRDLPCRYGGEEFVILLPDTAVENGLKVADILREAVKSKEIRNRATGETINSVTISMGVAQLGEGESVKDWIERSDKALYRAKKKGRDRIEQAKEPIIVTAD